MRERTDEDALVERAIAGDGEAFEAALRAATPDLRAMLQKRISPSFRTLLDPDDVLQVTFLEAFLGIDRFSPSGAGPAAALRAWLSRLAENNVRDAIRMLEAKKRPSPRRKVDPANAQESFVALVEVLNVTTTTPSRQAAMGEALRVMQEALGELPEAYARVITMFDLQGMSAEEIGRELGRSPGAVYMLRARAHERLRASLGTASQFFSVGS